MGVDVMDEWLEQVASASGIDAETIRQIAERAMGLQKKHGCFAVLDALRSEWPWLSFDMVEQPGRHGYITANGGLWYRVPVVFWMVA